MYLSESVCICNRSWLDWIHDKMCSLLECWVQVLLQVKLYHHVFWLAAITQTLKRTQSAVKDPMTILKKLTLWLVYIYRVTHSLRSNRDLMFLCRDSMFITDMTMLFTEVFFSICNANSLKLQHYNMLPVSLHYILFYVMQIYGRAKY